jgi:hypothetical protein
MKFQLRDINQVAHYKYTVYFLDKYVLFYGCFNSCIKLSFRVDENGRRFKLGIGLHVCTLSEKSVLQLLKKTQGFLSGHIFATLRGSSGFFRPQQPLKALANLKNL